MQQAATTDHAQMMFDALAADESIQAEVRSVYGDQLTDSQCVHRVIEARWPNLRERDSYAAAAYHNDVAVSA